MGLEGPAGKINLRVKIIYRNIAIYSWHMGATKAEEFSVKDNRIAAYAKALSHPARVAILKLLLKKKACICGDIVDELPLSQSTVSQHLKELKQAGLIKGDIEGVKICYCVDEAEWDRARKMLNEFFQADASAGSCC
jgi:DNA-binding transcriptional ArsR family regulator